ncbi:hypothetical protein K505DRAFT_368564 [Melanomma pulvis-pyrius CBS 109.77]|uniref:Phosphodiester glycosidase domain-containing protein n=1 Tax=Melanomma pulvis-pyrius CBS 109.77 TaxID=1314802 RepID=A0A6A6WPP6_9PLEO|nr:hypothetical protein K505DRAFT_368564 [Melanomma pulvis-pyrius CBS 109.77]
MRPNLLPALRAVLSLGALGAFASVTCDPKHDLGNNSTDTYIPSAGVLAEVANNCIEDVCATRGSAGSVTKDCRPDLLTITYLGAPLSDVRDFIKGFRNIVDQCITTEGVYGGILQTHDILYDIVAVDQHEGQEGIEELGNRSDEDEDDDFLQKQRLVARRKGRKSKSKTKLTTQPKAKTPKKPKTPKTPKKPKKPKKPKNKTKAKKPKNKTKACPLPKKGKGKGKGGKKTIRDVVEDLLPQVLSNALFPRGNQQSSNSECDNSKWYLYTQLSKRAEVDWWAFNRMDSGWKETHPVTTNVGKVLNDITLKGKFDVIRLTNAKIDVVCNPDKAVLPNQIPVGIGKYLLTNVDFFWMSSKPEKGQSIGPTILSPNSKPIPDRYAEYYDELREGSKYLSAGPSLKSPVSLSHPKFAWNEENTKIPGSLAHASQFNERLAIAIVGRDKYIFAYTAERRDNGVTVNKLRVIIDTFLKEFASSSVSAASTALNLDGGSSIFVAWRKRGVETVIARGSVGDDGPPWGDGFDYQPSLSSA